MRSAFIVATLAVALAFASAARAEEEPAAPPPAPAEPSPAAPAAPSPRPRSLDPDDGAPVGRAAPPTESARGDGPVRAGLEIFAQYGYRSTRGPGGDRAWFHVFDVPRVHGAVEGDFEHVRGRLVVEATRSAAEGALLGVAGDSLVLRVREAYAAYRAWELLEVSAGVVPTLTVPELDGTWMMRVVAPSALESNGLLAPADLGAKARVELPRNYGWVGVAATNGEGYTSRELNRGKNAEGAVEIHPLPEGALRPLAVFASYSAGSSGSAQARANRFTGGLLWQGARLRAGAYATYGWGFAQLGTQRTVVASGFVRAEPVNRFLVGARLDHVVRDAETEPADAITTLWLTAGARVADPLEAFVALTRAIPTTRARDELPGSNLWELRVMGRVLF